MMATAVVERKAEDFKSEVKVTWCPGCGDFGVLNATYKALAEQGYDTKDVVVVSGIGCSSRFPFFVSTYGFHGVHGRALPIATGIKMSRPELEVVVFGGDGDAFAIGAGHFVHACRRNIDMCYVIMDNAVYGLTKGQYSPTAHVGFVSKTTPDRFERRGDQPADAGDRLRRDLRGARLLLEAEGSDEADRRWDQPQGLRGDRLLQPLPDLQQDQHLQLLERRDDAAARRPRPERQGRRRSRMALAEDPLYLGVFYQKEGDSFGDRVQARSTGDAAETQGLVEKLIAKYS